MRGWAVAVKIAFSISVLTVTAASGQIKNDNGSSPSIKVTGKSLGIKRGAEFHKRSWPVVDDCKAVKDANGVKGSICPSLNGGKWFPWADQGDGDGDRVAEAVDGDVPTPRFLTEGKWFTQRATSIWIPAEWAPIDPKRGITIRLYGRTSKRDYGSAVVRAVKVRFDYGNNETVEDCSAEKAVKPYDPSKKDQDGCLIYYWVSSRADGRSFTADGTYHPRLKIWWKVLSASINGFPVKEERIAGLAPPESSSDPGFYKVPVFEIQSLVTCKRPDTSCFDE
jgi:hypothetical protein